nr:hypothetical protein [Tanacetum cinerariifolium]
NAISSTNNIRQSNGVNNGDVNRMNNNKPRQEYRRKQNKVVEDSRKTANKYSVLDSLPEDNDQELQMLKEIMIVDNFLDKKMQPTVNEAIPWSKDKGGIAQDMNDNVINGIEGRVLNDDSYGV